MKKFLLGLLGLFFATAVQAQNDSFLAANGTFKSPMSFANTWTAVQTFSVAPVFGVLPSIPLAVSQVLQGNGSNVAAPVTFSAAIDAAIGSTRGAILERGAGGWQLLTPGAVGLPLVSNGAGADPTYQPLTGSALPTNTQIANYTIATSDCGKLVQAGTGSTGFFTVTLPGPGGFAAGCVVSVKNSDTARGKTLSGFPSDLSSILWPLQTAQIAIVNGAWATLVNPGRWKVPGVETFFIDGSVGNDANDGLASGSSAFATLGKFSAVIASQIDTQQSIITASFAAGQTWTTLALSTSIVGGGTINLLGNGGTANSTLNGSPALALDVSPTVGNLANSAVEIQGFTITCSGGGQGIFVRQGFVTLGPNMVFGACPGSFHVGAETNLARFILGANYSITGGASEHLAAVLGGLVQWETTTFTATLTGSPVFTTAFAFAQLGGQIFSSNIWTGATGASSKRYVGITGGVINTNFGGPNFFPGNLPGSVASGASYDSPGTPTVTGCGTAPGTVFGTDTSGAVTEGTTATGCTINFTTSNGPIACTFATSVAALQAGLIVTSLNSSAVTVAHPSTSSAALYWNCPQQVH